MRILLAFCICFHLAVGSALAQEGIFFTAFQQAAPQQAAPQQAAPQLTVPPVPQPGAPQQKAPQQKAPQQKAPQPGAPQQRATQPGATQPGATQQKAPQPGATQQAAPQSDPFKDDPAPSQPDNLDLDSTRGFNFDDSANTPFSNPSDFQSSVASNSNFSGASPQMIGDFGGGSSILTLGAGVGSEPAAAGGDFPIGRGAWSNMLTASIPLAGGSRRIKIAENNQVMPTDRWYSTVNYFHNSYQAIGTQGPSPLYPVNVVDSESLVQYTVGTEKTFCLWGSPFSIDVRMPFTGGVNQSVLNDQGFGAASDFYADTGVMGNLSTTLKAYLLEFKQTSISGGLQMSLPTGSAVQIGAQETYTTIPVPPAPGQPFVPAQRLTLSYLVDIDNNAVHLMPFLGAYRQIGNSCWLQAFSQIDVPTNGNDVRILEDRYDGTNNIETVRGDSLKEQTLLYADVSFGKWWYRNICECGDPRCQCGRRGLTGLASVLELHYTSSLNDADAFNLGGIPRRGAENRFDILNMTTGLQFELNQELRINLAGVFPLREGRFDSGGRRENRGFDSEFALQVNYLY